MGNSSSEIEIVLIDRPDKVYYAGETVSGFLSAPEEEVIRMQKATIALIGKVHLSQDANIDSNVIRYFGTKYMSSKAREFHKQKCMIYKRKEVSAYTDTSSTISSIMMDDDRRVRYNTGRSSMSSETSGTSDGGWCPTFSFKLPRDLPSHTNKLKHPAVLYTLLATASFVNSPKYFRHLNIRVLARASQEPTAPLEGSVFPKDSLAEESRIDGKNILMVAPSDGAYTCVQCKLDKVRFENTDVINMSIEQTPGLDGSTLKATVSHLLGFYEIYMRVVAFRHFDEESVQVINIYSGSSIIPPTHQYTSHNGLIHISRRYQIELSFKFTNGNTMRKTWPIMIFNSNSTIIHKGSNE
ncbi:hypothetical protein ACOME3_008680 [Neoechinorhynchus agilis]